MEGGDARNGSERLVKLADPARRPDLRSQVPFAVTGPIADIVVTAPARRRPDVGSITPSARLPRHSASIRSMRCWTSPSQTG